MIVQPVVEPMDRFTAQLVTVTSVGARCGGGDGAQRGPAPDTRTHLLRVRVRVQGEHLRRHGGPAPRRRLTEQWNVACFCVQIYLQTLQLPFDSLTICRIFARICQVLVNLSILCLGLELDNDG